MLAQFARTSQIQDANRPQRTAHDFTTVSAVNKKFKLESERFQTRLRGGRDVSSAFRISLL